MAEAPDTFCAQRACPVLSAAAPDGAAADAVHLAAAAESGFRVVCANDAICWPQPGTSDSLDRTAYEPASAFCFRGGTGYEREA